MDEIVKDFLIESGENLDRLDQDLVKLEERAFLQRTFGQYFPDDPHHQGKLRVSRIRPAGKAGPCGRKPAVAVARRRTYARLGNHQRPAGDG